MRWYNALLLGAVLLLVAAWESSAIPHYANECNYDESGQKYCTSYHITLYATWKIAEFFDNHNGTFSALFAAIVAVFTWRLWKSTDKLWVVTNQNFVTEHRPWISVDAKLTEFRFRNGNAVFDIEIILKNCGNSPATRVFVNAKAILPNTANVVAEQTQFREVTRTQAAGANGFVIFPEETVSFFQTLAVSKSQIESASFGANRSFVPYVFACVDYGFMFEKGNHQTSANFFFGGIPAQATDGVFEAEIMRFPLWDIAD